MPPFILFNTSVVDLLDIYAVILGHIFAKASTNYALNSIKLNGRLKLVAVLIGFRYAVLEVRRWISKSF